MRESSDTSLKILRLLADEECYPSQLRGKDIANQLELTKDETLLHVQCCVDNGLMDAKILEVSTFGNWTAREIGQIWGLTAQGHEFVHHAETWWEKARKQCAEAGIATTTSALAQTMIRLTVGDLPEEQTEVSPDETVMTTEKAMRSLQKQIEELSKLEGYGIEGVPWVHGWELLTGHIIERMWGKNSSQRLKFSEIEQEGYPGPDHDRSFRIRIDQHKALLESFLGILKLDLPEVEAGGVYGPGDEFAFYRDLSLLFTKAKTDILIVDPYFDHQVFLNLDAVPKATSIRVLLSKPKSEITTIAEKYGKSRSGRIEIRSLPKKRIHDRVLFLGVRGWVTGQSLKDIGKNQPTYLVELSEPSLTVLKKSHEELWKAAVVVYASGQRL